MARPSAAEAMYGHLPRQSNERPEQQQRAQSLADAMYGPKPKPVNSDRDSLLRLLKEANARVDARLQKEGRGR